MPLNCKVHCAEAEMCGVVSPLDKLAIGMRVGPNMATVAETNKQTNKTKNNKTIKMKNKRTNVNMQAQEVSRGWRWDQENFLTALADQWFQPN